MRTFLPAAAGISALAQIDGTGASQILQLINYGVLGLVVLAAVFGWIEFRPAVERLLKDLERKDNQIDSLVAVYEEKVIPLLHEANRTLSRMADIERYRRDEGDDGPINVSPRRPRR